MQPLWNATLSSLILLLKINTLTLSTIDIMNHCMHDCDIIIYSVT